MEQRRFVSRLTLALSAGLALCSTITACSPAAQRQAEVTEQDDWVTVAAGDRTEMLVRPSSLKWEGSWLSAGTKQNFTEPQASAKPGKTYLSARNDYRIDCQQRRLAYREIQAFAGPDLQGDLVQKTRIGEKNLKWMDAPERTVFGELLDYACKHAPLGPPATTQ
ncbi:MAG TPA: surface-adhesin E family protein [Steroidobacteraceae bacterium]|nr:surface-adhesin E family protein [Steroidobacteraceae bacterium]